MVWSMAWERAIQLSPSMAKTWVAVWSRSVLVAVLVKAHTLLSANGFSKCNRTNRRPRTL
jgi:hypothetical protein